MVRLARSQTIRQRPKAPGVKRRARQEIETGEEIQYETLHGSFG